MECSLCGCLIFYLPKVFETQYFRTTQYPVSFDQGFCVDEMRSFGMSPECVLCVAMCPSKSPKDLKELGNSGSLLRVMPRLAVTK